MRDMCKKMQWTEHYGVYTEDLAEIVNAKKDSQSRKRQEAMEEAVGG